MYAHGTHSRAQSGRLVAHATMLSRARARTCTLVLHRRDAVAHRAGVNFLDFHGVDRWAYASPDAFVRLHGTGTRPMRRAGRYDSATSSCLPWWTLRHARRDGRTAAKKEGCSQEEEGYCTKAGHREGCDQEWRSAPTAPRHHRSSSESARAHFEYRGSCSCAFGLNRAQVERSPL